MIHGQILTHLTRARKIIESARPISHCLSYADALTECEQVLSAIGPNRSGVLDVETELAVLRKATSYDDLVAYDARGQAYARAQRMTPAECDRLRVAVFRLERFFADDALSESA